jgi:hypothetical protein
MTADGGSLDSLEHGSRGPARNRHGGLVRSLRAGGCHACADSRSFGKLPGHMGRAHCHDGSRDRDRSRRKLHRGGNIGKHLGGFAPTEHVAAVESEQEEAEEAAGVVGERNSRS